MFRSAVRSVTGCLGAALLAVAAFALLPFFAVRALAWPLRRRLKQRPFDPAVWQAAAKPGRLPMERHWMTDDAVRRLQGKSRADVVALLGEPDGPFHLRHAGGPSDALLYRLSFSARGYSVLGFRLDGQDKVVKSYLAVVPT